jgi:hypothetical protein
MEGYQQDTIFISCPIGHRALKGMPQCTKCGLPIVMYEKELSEVVNSFKGLAREFVKVQQLFPIGLGLWGSRLLLTTLATYDVRLARFSTMGASITDLQSFATVKEKKMPKEEVDNILRKTDYPLKIAADTTGGIWKRAEIAARKDSALADRIGILGIHNAKEEQVAFFMGSLSEGIVAGVAPFLSSVAKEKNSNISRIFVTTIPSEGSSEQVQFNAYCGLANLVQTGAEVIIIMQESVLKTFRAISRSGADLDADFLLPYMWDMLLAIDIEGLAELSHIAQSFRLQVLSPALAFGASYEIYGSIANIIEHSLYNIMVPMNPENVIAAVAVARVPNKLLDKVGHDALQEQFTGWTRRRFPAIRGSLLRIIPKEESSDRIDTILLLGGKNLESIADLMKNGYNDFKSHAETMDLWQEYSITADEMKTIDELILRYDRRLGALLKTK